MFSGERCEIHANCATKGFQWTGRTCTCSEGYTGPLCDRCDPTIICLPNNKTGEYSLVHIEDVAIIKELLVAEQVPGYTLKPYQPNAKSSAGCTCPRNNQNPGSLNQQYNDEEPFFTNDNLFVHHYYKNTYKSTGMRAGPWIILTCIFGLAVVIALIFIWNNRTSVLPVTKVASKVPQPKPTIRMKVGKYTFSNRDN
jgi:hypothetical protein